MNSKQSTDKRTGHNNTYVSLPGKCKWNVLSLKTRFGYVGRTLQSRAKHSATLIY